MKQFTLLLAGLAFAATTNAQEVNTPNKGTSYISLGPVVGAGHSRVTNVKNQLLKPSPYAGIGLVYSKNENWGFGGDLVVSHEGFKSEYFIGTVSFTNSINPVYLRLTPKVYYFFGKYGDNIRPKVYLGPSIAYKIDEVQYFDGDKVDMDDLTSIGTPIYPEQFKNFDAGLTAGAGVNIKLASHTWLNLDGSFYQGLLDISDNSGFSTNLNQNIRLNVGLMFGL